MILQVDIHRTSDIIRIATEAGSLFRYLATATTPIEYVLTSGGYRLTTPIVEYRGDVIEDIEISKEIADVFYGVAQSSTITIRLANADNGVDDTWDEIAAEEELRGCRVVFKRDDTEHLATGVITGYTLGDEATITVAQKDEILNTILPKGIVTSAAFSDTALDVGRPIPILFGHVKNVPCPNICRDTGNDYYDYLIGYGTLESLWIDHANGRGVKREGVLVDEAEYTFYDGSQVSPYAGFAFIRFTVEQVGFSNEPLNITADVYGLELGGTSADRNYANVIKAILNNSTWGLNQSVDTTSFATAATTLTTASWMCDRAIYSQAQARDILNDMLFACRSWIDKGSDGEWEITVDGTGSSVATFGENDGYYNNCEVLDCTVTEADNAIKTAYVNYDNNEKQIFLACNTAFGVDQVYELKSVGEDTTAEKVLSYIYGRSHYADKKITIKAGVDAEKVVLGNIVTITADERDITSTDYRVVKISRKLNEFVLECEAYNASIFDDQVISAPTARSESSTTHDIRTIDNATVGGMTVGATTIICAGGTLLTSANSLTGEAGIRINENGFYAGTAVQDTTNANVRILADGSAYFSGTVTIGTGSDIAGWITNADSIYKLSSGTPDSLPDTGITLETVGGANTLPVIRVYDGATLNAALGNYADGKYGVYAIEGSIGGWDITSASIQTGAFDTNGTMYFGTSGISLSDTFNVTAAGAITATSGTIGGFTLAATTLTATNLLLDAGNQTIQLGSGDDIISLDADDATYRLAVGHATYGSAPFRVTKAGVLTATGATVSGTVTATAGTIGGFTLSASALYAGADATRIQLDTSSGIHLGATLFASAPFRVTLAGALTATGVDVTGAIKASSGYIGGTADGWAIGSALLSGGSGASYIALDQANSKIRIGAKESLVDANTGVHLGSDGLALGASSVFKVTHEGVLTATSATITGVVTANTGYIGGTSGWVIASGKMTSTGIGLATTEGDATYAFWAGNDAPADAEFSVSHAGALTATSATITGSITATTGAIGGFTIAATTLTATNLLLDSANQKIALGSGNDIVILDADDATNRMWIGHAEAASAPFVVTKAGAVTCSNITVTGGAVAGFTPDATEGLYVGSGVTRVQMKPGAGIWCGATAIGDAPFSVSNAGALVATSATVVGDYKTSATVGTTKGVHLDVVNNELYFYGDAGGGVEELASIGLNTVGSYDHVIASFGTYESSFTGTPLLVRVGSGSSGTIISADRAGGITSAAFSVRVDNPIISDTNFSSFAASISNTIENTEYKINGTMTGLGISIGVANPTSATTGANIVNAISIIPIADIDGTTAITTYKGLNLQSKQGSSGITTYYAIYQEDADADNYFAGDIILADDTFIGLASDKGRIQFDDEATDEISFLDCIVNFPNSALRIKDTGDDNYLIIATGSDLTANKTLTLTTGDADRTITLSGNPTLNDWFDQSVKAAASPTFATVKLSGLADGYIPYHVADATGLADSPFYTDGTNVGLGVSSFSSPNSLNKYLQIGHASNKAGINFQDTAHAWEMYTNTNLLISKDTSNYLLIDTSGGIYVSESQNAGMTIGITINQGANDDEIFSLKSSDVAHTCTGEAETDTFATIRKSIAASGGFEMLGLSEANDAIRLTGGTGSEDTTTSTGAVGCINLNAAHIANNILNAMQPASDDKNLLCVMDCDLTRFIVKADGDIYYDGADQGAYDIYDDALMCQDLSMTLSGQLARVLKYNKETLHNAGVIEWTQHDNGKEDLFVSRKGMDMLQLGAIGELYRVVDKLCDKLGISYEEAKIL